MAKQRLTDRQRVSGLTINDLVHVVVTGDTSQNPEGSSYKAEIGDLFATFSSHTCTYGIVTDQIDSCSGSITINGDLLINGSATTINTEVIQSKDNNIILNYSGTHATAIGGGITVEDGQSTGVDSKIYINSNGEWLIEPSLSSSTGTINTLSACTGVYTSNLYGCSPITIHDNIQSTSSSATGTTSFAFGDNVKAYGNYSHAEGSNTTANGTYSHAEGYYTSAMGESTHAEGNYTTALNYWSHAEGDSTIASGQSSHAEGVYTTSIGNYSHAEGESTTSYGSRTHAEGQYTIASGDSSHAEGGYTTSQGNYGSHSEGWYTVAQGNYGSHSEGQFTSAIGVSSHAEGSNTTSFGTYSHAGGLGNIASGQTSFIHSTNSVVTGDRSVVLGGQNITGTSSDTVYVPYLNIKNVFSGTPTTNIGIDSNGLIVSGTSGSLTYFTETGTTATPNGSVSVGALISKTGGTNMDFAIIPKGNGSILAAIPDNTTTGGNKRGTNSVDLQLSRSAANQVVSGNYSFAAGSNNRVDAAYSTSIGQGNVVTNNWGTAIGRSNTAGGDSSVVLGFNSTASNNRSIAIGETCTASAPNAVALGVSNTSSGGGAFTSGYLNNGTGSYSSAIGYGNTSGGFSSVALGTSNSTAYDYNYAIGSSNTLTSGPSGNNSYVFAFGLGNTVNAGFATAIGCYGLTNGVTGRQTFSSGRIATNGDAQKSTFIYRGRTTDATLTTLATDGNNSINAGNCMQLANNSSIRFKGTVSGKQSGSTNIAAWDVDGLIVRGASAASTILTISNVNLVSNIPGWGTPVLSAFIDAFNGVGGLRLQIQGAVGTNIQWTAVIETTEVIYA
jgi:hypothetical protein